VRDKALLDDRRRIKISKYLSKHLRHQPERLGLTLEPGGWVSIDAVLTACAAHRFAITREELREVVACSEKRRFAFNETETKLRAHYGHSVDVDLQPLAAVPPPVLFHGTDDKSVEFIQVEGLKSMGRSYVHLSIDVDTAIRVGRRHGKPVVLQVDAAAMSRAGYEFYVSEGGVWLVDQVPAEFLARL
jgi:putative RNA 2'-phosphotransferase